MKTPVITNKTPEIILNKFFGSLAASLYPRVTAMRVEVMRANPPPTITDKREPCFTAMENDAICVLSPSSARKTRMKVEINNPFPLIAGLLEETCIYIEVFLFLLDHIADHSPDFLGVGMFGTDILEEMGK